MRISGNTIVNYGLPLDIAPGGAIESDGSNRFSYTPSVSPNSTMVTR
jgi:hypothetical protein